MKRKILNRINQAVSFVLLFSLLFSLSFPNLSLESDDTTKSKPTYSEANPLKSENISVDNASSELGKSIYKSDDLGFHSPFISDNLTFQKKSENTEEEEEKDEDESEKHLSPAFFQELQLKLCDAYSSLSALNKNNLYLSETLPLYILFHCWRDHLS